MKPKNHRLTSSSAALFIALAASPGILADTITWDGNGSNDASGNWSLGDNWDTTAVPGALDTAVLTDVTSGTRTVTFDTAATSPVQQIDFNQSTAAATNVLDLQKNLTVTNAITLDAAAGTERISIGSTAAASFVLTPTGGITLNPGGELVMTSATNTAGRGFTFGNTGGSGTTTIQGGTLTVAPTTGTSTGTSAAINTHAGSLTMTSGSLVIDNITGQQDRRLTIQGVVNITGGTVSSTKAVAAGNLTFSSGSPVVFNPDSFSTNLHMSLDRGAGDGAQSLSTNKTLGNMLFRSTGVKTVTSSAIGTGIGQLQIIDGNGTGGSQTTVQLGSNLSSNAGANMPAAMNFGNTHESGRIDLGIDTNGFTLDLTAGAGSGAWTPNKSTQSGVTNTVWNLSGSGVIKANRFNFNTADVTTNVAANTVLTAAGGNSTATDLGGTGTIDATSTFRYSGTAAVATPATLASNRTIGMLDVTSGTLKLSGTLDAAGTTTVAGGTLIVPLTASLYGGTTGSWTAANLNVLSGGTLAFGVGGAGEFATTDVTSLLTILAASSDNGLRAGAALGFDTTNASGGTFTVADTLADTTGTTGGSLGIHKLGTNTLVLGASNSYTGQTTVTAGVLRVSNSGGLGGTAGGTVVNGTLGNSNFFGTALELNGVSIGSGESLTMASGNLSGLDIRATLRTVGTTSNTWAGGVLLTGSRNVQFHANNGGQFEISGAITHSSYTGPVTLRGGGTGTLSGGVSLSSATNITMNDETSVWNINTTGNTWGNTNVFRGTLVLGANDALPTTTSLNLGGTDGSGTLKLNGRSQTVAGLTTNVTTTTNKVVNGNATAGALTVNNSTANVFAGVLGGTGTDENEFSLTKSGSGTLTLSAANTYSGDTTVTEGTLKLDNPNANNESSTVTIAAGGATLELNFDETGGPVTDTVDKLFIGAVQQNAGVYKATDNGTDSGTPIAQITGPGTLTVTTGPGGLSPYDDWATSKGLTAGNKAKDLDPDNDGRNNLGEFAFNGDPLSGSDNGKVFVLTEDSDADGDATKELILTVAVRSGTPAFTGTPSPSANLAADAITYTIEGSLDLGGFPTTVNVVPTQVTTDLPAPGTGYEYRSFSLDGSNGLTGKGFLRAKVTSP
jgi:autotransporter-associated beta strand protein